MGRLDTHDAPDFVYWAMTQVTTVFDDTPNSLPTTLASEDDFDGSGLVSWAAGRVDVFTPEGAANLLDYCVRFSKVIPLSDALRTKGALLFPYSAEIVAISLGDGKRTIEASGRLYGVWPTGASVYGSRWGNGAWVPGMRYT
jgi:hypothetical protein